jgi:hypothetical protein
LPARDCDTPVAEAKPHLADLSHHGYAIKTWRYLRLAMVAVVSGLFVAVLTERLKAHPACFLGSISDYYYTPVRADFVGATLALGVCLICLRGSTETEDALLNLAGILAFVVALVPTEYSVTGAHCASVPTVFDNTSANVANNILAFLIVAGIVLLIIFIKMASRGATLPTLASSVAAGLLWLTAAGVFSFDRAFFVETAHFAAAVPMFVCIAGVAIVNALDVDNAAKHRQYAAIAVAMFVLPLAIGAIGLLTHWSHTVISVEAVVLVLFAIFWIVQTRDLWDTGLRPDRDARQARKYKKVTMGRHCARSATQGQGR